MSTNEAIDYEHQLMEAFTKLERKTSKAHETWSGKQCAEYLNCSERHFKERLSKRGGFPAAKPTGLGERSRKVWIAKEVIQWLNNRS